MKTNSTNFMKKIILSAITAWALLAAVNAEAGVWGNFGKAVYRQGFGVEAQGIAWEFLNDKIIYAHMKHRVDLNDAGIAALCNEIENSYGRRLFDLDPALCNNQSLLNAYAVYSFVFDSYGTTWNFYDLIAPINLESQLDDQIVEIQMGSTITRSPPKILRVMEKSDTCKDDGPILPRSNVKIICNGWSWESLDQYFGKEVPPELKALNGTGVQSESKHR